MCILSLAIQFVHPFLVLCLLLIIPSVLNFLVGYILKTIPVSVVVVCVFADWHLIFLVYVINDRDFSLQV